MKMQNNYIIILGGDLINIVCEQVVEQYADMVYRISISNTKHKEDAEDIFQEVFLSLIKNTHKIQDEKHLKCWLIRTTINLCKNLFLCFWKKRVCLEDSKFNLENSKSDTNPKDNNSEDLYYNEVNNIRDEIQNLRPKQRAVIYLHYYEGYDVKEISEILQIPEGTVKSRLNSARKNLKSALERG